jgi:hypothetical protein
MISTRVFIGLSLLCSTLTYIGSANNALCAEQTANTYQHATTSIGINISQTSTNTTSSEKVSPQLKRLTEILSLTPEQVTEIKAIISAKQTALQPIYLKIKTDNDQLVTVVFGLPYDAAAVSTITTQLGADIASLTETSAKAGNQIYALLTPEQHDKFKKTPNLPFSLLR